MSVHMAVDSTEQVTVSWSTEFEELSSWLPHVLVSLAGTAWAIWFARLAVKSWNGFWFGVFDLGIFDQGVWLLSRGTDPFITLRGLHLFGDHSSWVLILIAPLYLVWPNINLLVILAAVIPALAAWLSFRIGLVEGLRTWPAAAIAIAVLLHPAMAWTTWDSFHPETLAIALIPAAYLAARRGHPWWFVTLGMLVGIVKEDAFLVVIPLAIYIGWRWKELQLHAVGLGLLVAGLAVFNFGVALPAFSPTGELIYTGRYSWEIGLVITWSRFGYLAAMLLPIAIALRAPLLLAVAGPITAANVASLFPYQQEIRWHYTAYLLGVLAIAAPVGLAKLFDSWGSDVGLGLASSSRHFKVPLVLPLLGLAFVGLMVLGPDITFSGVWGAASPERQAEVNAAFDMIPDDAVVAASHTFAPHLAHRTRVYMMPNPWVADSWGVTEHLPPQADPSEIEWMVINFVSAGDTELNVVEEAIEDGWTEAASGDGFTLLRAPSR